MQTTEGKDSRKLTRFPVNVKVYNDADGESLGYTSNMHVEGMMLMSFTVIEVDTEYRVRLETLGPDDEIVQIRLSARCLWCKQADNQDVYNSGFYFSELNMEQRGQVIHLIEAMATKS
ncbi:MAG TPA: PilZ domain-containing protein [Gammaproteobacteria bacterium]|nr:PilZ domain-containing protein [Gammaproteobacteria bacterium]